MNLPNGEYKGMVVGITINPVGNKPVIFTRLMTNASKEEGRMQPEYVTHAIRLNNLDSVRIGFDELRTAFPQQLATLDDEALLTFLMEKTDELLTKTVTFAIEPQLRNGVQVVGPKGQKYFNIRLRSSIKNLANEDAKKLAKSVLAGLTTKAAVADVFDTEEHDS